MGSLILNGSVVPGVMSECWPYLGPEVFVPTPAEIVQNTAKADIPDKIKAAEFLLERPDLSEVDRVYFQSVIDALKAAL